MKILLLFFLGLLGGCRSDAIDHAVIVLVLDGVRPQESFGDEPSDAAGTDHPSEILPTTWESMVPEGVRATLAVNDGATLTASAHAALLTGRWTPLGNYEVTDEDPGLYRPEIPTLMEAMRGQLGLAQPQVAMTGNTVLIEPITYGLWPMDGCQHGADFVMVYDDELPSEKAPAQDDRLVFDSLQSHLSDTHPQFLLVNLHQSDRVAHESDVRSAYATEVASLDPDLSTFWEWIEEDPIYSGKTWLFVVADHGRHESEAADPPWRDHGDSCWGCRHIPLLLMGPGVKAGAAEETPVLITDLAPTIAAMLGFDLPWAEGRVAKELFEEPPDQRGDRSGLAGVAVAEGRAAEVRYLDDPWAREELVVDGVTLSTPGALRVAAPGMASSGDSTYLCFREMVLRVGESAPWVPRCFVDQGAGWEEIGAPEEKVSAYWEPTMLADPGGLFLVYAKNPNDIASFGQGSGVVGVKVARYNGHGWKTAASPEEVFSFPGTPAAVYNGRGLLVAVAAGIGGVEARHERRIVLAPISTEDGQPKWEQIDIPEFDALFDGELFRLERPALDVGEDGVVRLAALAHTDAETRVLVASLGSGGWEGEVLLSSTGAVMPHLAPLWYEDRVVFPSILAEKRGSEICLGSPIEPVRCRQAGAQRLLDMDLDGEVLHLLTDEGVGSWEPSTFELSRWRD